MLKLLAVLCTAACAYAADTTLITFDGAAGTTHSFKAVRLATARTSRRVVDDPHSPKNP